MKQYRWYLMLAVLLSVVAFLAPLILTSKPYTEFGSTTGFIGDTIGGLTAPFLSLAGSILVFAALKAQIDANQAVQDQFREQQALEALRSVEDRLFHLLELRSSIINSAKAYWETFLPNEHGDVDWRIKEIVGFEYNDKLSWLKKHHSIMEGDDVLEKALIMFDWAVFDGSDRTKEIGSRVNAQKALDFFYDRLHRIFFRYCQNMLYIFKMVDTSILLEKSQKADFIRLVQNHLSYSELKWLLWFSVHPDFIELQPFFEKYHFFDRLQKEDLIHKGYIDFSEIYPHIN